MALDLQERWLFYLRPSLAKRNSQNTIGRECQHCIDLRQRFQNWLKYVHSRANCYIHTASYRQKVISYEYAGNRSGKGKARGTLPQKAKQKD